MGIETMYRYVEEVIYDDETHFRVVIRPLTYRVVKTTPCGVWIERSHSYPYLDRRYFRRYLPKWVSTTPGKKRFAYPTEKEALESFIERKRSHVRHARWRLNIAESALSVGKEELGRGAQEVVPQVRRGFP